MGKMQGALGFYVKLCARVASARVSRLLGTPCVPYKWNFTITHMCNSRCMTCGIWGIYSGKDRRFSPGQELKTAEVKRLLFGHRHSILWLNLTGGEITLRQDIGEILEYAADVCPGLGIVNMPLNGLNPGRTFSFLQGVLSRIDPSIKVFATLSLDGPRDVHDRVRGVPGAYERLFETYSRLRELERKHSNFSLEFQFTISRYNIGIAERFVTSLQKMGRPITIAFAIENPRFYNREGSVRALNRQVARVVRSYLRRTPLRSAQDLLMRLHLVLGLYFFSGRLRMPCYSSCATLSIDPYGNVLACPYSSVAIGNVRKKSLGQILSGSGFVAANESSRKRACSDCWAACEAYPAILSEMPRALALYLRSVMGHSNGKR